MTKEMKYKTVLSSLKKGEKPCYRAVPITNGTTDLAALAQGAAARTGQDVAFVKCAAELLLERIEYTLCMGRRVELDGLFSCALAVQGVFDAANAPWERGKHRLVPRMNAKGEMKTVLTGTVAVNVTEGNRCRITSVLDAISKTEGVITEGTNVEVFVAGGTFLVDTTAEDEGVWLEDKDGTIVSFGTVTASTATTLDATFATLPEPGAYKFVVATRGGLGKGYGVSIARRNVEVRNNE